MIIVVFFVAFIVVSFTILAKNLSKESTDF